MNTSRGRAGVGGRREPFRPCFFWCLGRWDGWAASVISACIRGLALLSVPTLFSELSMVCPQRLDCRLTFRIRARWVGEVGVVSWLSIQSWGGSFSSLGCFKPFPCTRVRHAPNAASPRVQRPQVSSASRAHPLLLTAFVVPAQSATAGSRSTLLFLVVLTCACAPIFVHELNCVWEV